MPKILERYRSRVSATQMSVRHQTGESVSAVTLTMVWYVCAKKAGLSFSETADLLGFSHNTL